MRQHRGLLATALAIGGIALGWVASATAGESYLLTGPYAHDNLAIYLIHREGRNEKPVPLTLGEAMEQGLVKVIETGDVEELIIRNLSELEVFIQSGDIVKGGKQDRVLTVSMIVPPYSDDIPVGAFCVEQGRWSGRGQEKTTAFSVSTARLPSKAGKIAIVKRVQREIVAEDGRVASQPRLQQRSDEASFQEQVWDSVREVQMNLGQAMKLDIANERSRSSLQLSLENAALAAALGEYEAALSDLLQGHPEAVGYVFAINGRINSGDEFGNAGLFRKLWPRQLNAAATEAIGEEDASIRKQPTLAEVAAFIDEVRAAEPVGKFMPGRMSLETRETEKALYTEIRRQNGLWMHRSFIAH